MLMSWIGVMAIQLPGSGRGLSQRPDVETGPTPFFEDCITGWQVLHMGRSWLADKNAAECGQKQQQPHLDVGHQGEGQIFSRNACPPHCVTGVVGRGEDTSGDFRDPLWRCWR